VVIFKFVKPNGSDAVKEAFNGKMVRRNGRKEALYVVLGDGTTD
jgi:hypothetical protein